MMQTKSSVGKSNIMGRLVDEIVTNVSGQFRSSVPAPEQTKEHTEEQTVKRTHKQTLNRTDNQTDKQSNRWSAERSTRHSTDQSPGHNKEQSKKLTSEHIEGPSEEQSARHNFPETHIWDAMDRSAPPFAHFTERQSVVLAFMIYSRNKYITLEYIAYATGLTFASVRTAIRTLRRYKYILNTGRFRHLKTQCLQYELDEIRCEQFWKKKGVFYDFSKPLTWSGNALNTSSEKESIEQTIRQTEQQSEEQSNKQTVNRTENQTLKQTDLLSSTVSSKELLLTEIAETFATHPDFAFWVEEKLEPDTVLRWIEEFSDVPVKAEDMLLYLSRCSYDLTTLNKKSSLKNTPVNYFYGCIKRNKTYLPPPGFKSFEERILEDKRKIVEEMENRVRELQALEERERQADIEIRFRKMMNEGAGELYNTCLNNIPSVFRDNDRSGPGFKTAMKQAFMKIPNM